MDVYFFKIKYCTRPVLHIFKSTYLSTYTALYVVLTARALSGCSDGILQCVAVCAGVTWHTCVSAHITRATHTCQFTPATQHVSEAAQTVVAVCAGTIAGGIEGRFFLVLGIRHRAMVLWSFPSVDWYHNSMFLWILLVFMRKALKMQIDFDLKNLPKIKYRPNST